MTGFRPRQRSRGLFRQEVEGETLLYDEQHHRALCLDGRAARIWRLCDGSRDANAISDALAAEGTPLPVQAVVLTVERLGKARLLDRPVPHPRSTLSRRQLIRQLGMAAIPAILLITAPPARAAVSCASLGQSCASVPCCSGLDCGQNSQVCGGP
jgi:hypothetical protein